MLVIPAIDLRGGRCVRLIQGDYNREIVFDEDPSAVARRWEVAGAAMIHVVDLEGARQGGPAQRDAIAGLARAVDLPIQVGGGLRTVEDAANLLESGIDRVIIGTAALKNPPIVVSLIEQYGTARVVVGIDARNGFVATNGWLETSDTSATDLIRGMHERGVERVVYTDIERDGTLGSPNFDAIRAVSGSGPAIIASGGVARRDHLQQLANIPGVEAAIVGRALYSGDLVLEYGDWVWPPTTQSRGEAT